MIQMDARRWDALLYRIKSTSAERPSSREIEGSGIAEMVKQFRRLFPLFQYSPASKAKSPFASEVAVKGMA